MGFSRQEYWSGFPCLLHRILPTQGSNLYLLHVLHWQVGSLSLVPPGEAPNLLVVIQSLRHVQFSGIPWTAVHQASLPFTISQRFLRLVHWFINANQSFRLLSSPSTPALSFPAPGYFPVSHLFVSGGQSIGTSASAPVLPMDIQGWFPLGLTGWISLQAKGLSRVFSSTTVWKHQFFGAQPSLRSNSYILIGLLKKPYLWLYGPLSAKWCLCFLIHCLVLS